MKKEVRETVDKFSKNLTFVSDELENYVGYLRLSPEKQELAEKAIKILKKKAKALRKAKSKEEVKEVIRLGKLLNNSGDDE
jgi:hypothetical protein